MAEGLVNHLLGDSWTARSAGMSPAERVHPMAVRAMAEVGVDLAGARPKPVHALLDEPWDLVVTVCDAVQESCPVFPRRVPTLHLPFFDPARAEGTEEERLAVFRRVRDEIRDTLLGALRDRTAPARIGGG
jgi:arsenate reductase